MKGGFEGKRERTCNLYQYISSNSESLERTLEILTYMMPSTTFRARLAAIGGYMQSEIQHKIQLHKKRGVYVYTWPVRRVVPCVSVARCWKHRVPIERSKMYQSFRLLCVDT